MRNCVAGEGQKVMSSGIFTVARLCEVIILQNIRADLTSEGTESSLKHFHQRIPKAGERPRGLTEVASTIEEMSLKFPILC